MQVLVLSMFLASPPMVTGSDLAKERASKVTLLGRAVLGSAVGTGVSLGLAQGLAGWSNELVSGLAPTVLIGALGPGLSAHFSLRRSARKLGWRVTRPLRAATAALTVSSAAFAALVSAQQTSNEPWSAISYLALGAVAPVAAQWWALEPMP